MSFHCHVIFRVLIDVVRDKFVTLNTARVYLDISTEMFNSAYVLCDPKILLCIVMWLVYNREQFVKYTTRELHLHCVVDRWLMLGGYTRPQFYQTRSAWSKDQGSTKKHSAVHNFVPTVTKFCVLWEGLSPLVTVEAKLWTGEWFSFNPWSLDQVDLAW